MIIDVITAIRESFVGADTVYTHGSCYQLYKILKAIYPQAKAYYDSDHVITYIDGNFYDITGQVEIQCHIPVEGNYNLEMMEDMRCEVVKIKTLSTCASV